MISHCISINGMFLISFRYLVATYKLGWTGKRNILETEEEGLMVGKSGRSGLSKDG